MRFLFRLFLILTVSIFLGSCKGKNETDNLNNKNVHNETEATYQDSIQIKKARSILAEAIKNIQKERLDGKTEKLLDSARLYYKKLKHIPIKDLSNLYSYYDVFTYFDFSYHREVV